MKVAAVVIGRNEGDRLRRCLESLAVDRIAPIYVDSGSSDSSVALARSLGAEVVELDPTRPFSAARARNEGFQRCLSQDATVEAVLFVDGDCEVVAGFTRRAAQELADRPELAVVCGRRAESDPGRSVYNRLADLEWDTPIGLAASCGGDALMRVTDFLAVGGFDPMVRAGEEPELCRRLRAAGRLVARIDAPMARHDLAMTRLAQWWRRQVRFGYHALALERESVPPVGPDGRPMPSLFSAALRRSRAWGIGWPVAVLAGAVLAGAAAGPIAALGVVGLGLAVLIAQVGRLAWRVRHQVASTTDALAYGALMLLDKWANLAGQVSYLLDRRAGRGARLIEYRTLGASPNPTTGRGGPLLTAESSATNDQ